MKMPCCKGLEDSCNSGVHVLCAVAVYGKVSASITESDTYKLRSSNVQQLPSNGFLPSDSNRFSSRNLFACHGNFICAILKNFRMLMAENLLLSFFLLTCTSTLKVLVLCFADYKLRNDYDDDDDDDDISLS
uniref:Transmembrane protein n=1 Tax=Syphacia muris TaxID=451379 RepID=A0A0N5AVA7_9BILA